MRTVSLRRVAQLVVLVALAGVATSLWADYAEQQRLRARHDVRRTNGPHEVVLFVADWCGYCRRLERWLDRSGVPYRSVDVEQSFETARAHAIVAGRSAGVPTTVIGTDVYQGLDTDALRERLARAGHAMKGEP